MAADLVQSFLDMAESSTSFSASFLQGAADLIAALGYTLTDGDDVLLAFSAEYVEQEIRNACNVPEVPYGLYPVATELIVARFLTAVKGRLTEAETAALDFTPILKELHEGDTRLVWDAGSGSSAAQRLDLLIAHLESGKSQFVTYRRLKW